MLIPLFLLYTESYEKKEEERLLIGTCRGNAVAFVAKLKGCRNNPGKLENTHNCQNVELARHKIFAMNTATLLKFEHVKGGIKYSFYMLAATLTGYPWL